jgi:hypothetical protein
MSHGISVAAVGLFASLTFNLAQWLKGRRDRQFAEIALLRDLRAEWVQLRPSWGILILSAKGDETDYYNIADAAARERFRKLRDNKSAQRDAEAELAQW